MADQLFTFISAPGVRRDGTQLDSPFYTDGEWVRWQRGKPRKMGGYRATNVSAQGPVRHVVVDARNGQINAHYFSRWGIQRQAISASGASGALDDRTPAVFDANESYTWTHGFLFDPLGGAYTSLIACATPDADKIDSDDTGNIYAGNATDGSPMSVLMDDASAVAVSGGICVLQPFLFAYGSNGLIMNTKPNDLSATAWDGSGGSMANAANVAGTKIIYGHPVRGGSQSPAGMFWSLDSVIRVTFVGGTAKFTYDPLATPASPLSKRAIVEFDGRFIWPTIDRFLMYTGVIQEVPNDFNQNWFFDNLNFAARSKVWGTKIQRFGEIWWFYPRGNATECTDAVIFNYRENCWYDAHLMRSAGDKAGTFKYPVWAGEEDGLDTLLVATGVRGAVTAQTDAGLGAPAQNAASSTATGGTGLESGTEFFYKITATNAAGESLPSNEVSVVTAGGIPSPGNLGITTQETGGIGLSSGTTYFYKVTALNGVGETTGEEEVQATTEASGIGTPTLTDISTSSSGGTGPNDGAPTDGLAPNTAHYYKVTALNAAGETVGSNELSVTTPASLAEPTMNSATIVSGGTLTAGHTYFYAVAAVNGNGETLPSNEVSATPSTSVTAPTLDALSYTIDGADPTGFIAGQTYYYKVSTVDGSSESAPSNERSITVPNQVPAPTKRIEPFLDTEGSLPIGVTYDCYVYAQPFPGSSIQTDATYMGRVGPTTSTHRSVVLGWNLTSPDDEGYVAVLRNVSTGETRWAGEGSGVNQIWVDASFFFELHEWPLAENNTAKGTVNMNWNDVAGADEYKVYRGTSSGAQDLVKETNSATSSLSDRGTGMSAGSPSSGSGRSIALSWDAVPGATEYRLYRGDTTGVYDSRFTPGNVTSYTDDGSPTPSAATPNTTNTTTKPTVSLEWDAVPGATSYNVYRGTAAGSQDRKLVLGNVTTYTDTGTDGVADTVPVSNTTGNLPTNTITWDAVTGATGYRIYRGTASDGQNVFYEVGAVTSFMDQGDTVDGSASPPGSNTTASATSSNEISWAAVTGATGYRVYRGTASDAQDVYYAVGAVTTYTDTGATSSAGSPPAHNTTSVTLNFSDGPPAGVAVGFTVTAYADPYLVPGTTVTGVGATTVTISDSPLLDIPSGTLIAFSTQDDIIVARGQTVTGATSGATGTLVQSSYTTLNLKDVAGEFEVAEVLNLSDGRTAKVFSTPLPQQLDAIYQHEFGWDKIVGTSVTPIRASFASQNYGLAVGAPFKPDPDNASTSVMTRVTRFEPDFNLVGEATLIIEGRSFAQQANRELARYTISAGQEFQDMREQERILRFRLESNAIGGFFEQGQVLMSMEPGDERSGSDA